MSSLSLSQMVWAEMYSTEGKNGMDSAIAHDQIGNVNYYFERDECGMKSMIHGVRLIDGAKFETAKQERRNVGDEL